jgi:hypothetical protein
MNLLSSAWGVAPIFADVPEINGEDNARFPYVSFGPDVETPWDTKTSFGAEVSIQIDVWSRQAGYTEAKQVVGLIYRRLHYQPLTLPDGHLVYLRCDSATTSLDPDGHTRRGLMLFTAVYDDIDYDRPWSEEFSEEFG